MPFSTCSPCSAMGGGYGLWEGGESSAKTPGRCSIPPEQSRPVPLPRRWHWRWRLPAVPCAAALEQHSPLPRLGDECAHGGLVHAAPLLAPAVGTLCGAYSGPRCCGDTGLALQVRDWTEDESSNQGLLVTVQALGGSSLEPPPLQFASGGDHHESKKPLLVLFTDDGRRGASLPTAGFPGGSPAPWHGSLGAAIPPPAGPRGAPHARAPSAPELLLQPEGEPPPSPLGLAPRRAPPRCGWPGGCEAPSSWRLCPGG